jgi:uncharacterized metal-binding protein
MDKTADEIASTMHAICSRKGMYFEPTDPATAMNFINGFLTGCFVFGRNLDWQSAEQQRGWKTNACGPIPEMQQRGLTDDAITDELLAILTVAVKQSST